MAVDVIAAVAVVQTAVVVALTVVVAARVVRDSTAVVREDRAMIAVMAIITVTATRVRRAVLSSSAKC